MIRIIVCRCLIGRTRLMRLRRLLERFEALQLESQPPDLVLKSGIFRH